MRGKLIPIALFALVLCMATWTIAGQGAEKGAAAQGSEQKIDAATFLKQFPEAYKANDQAKMEGLVRQAGIDIVYEAVISQAEEGITSVADGKNGSISFNTAEAMAATYARVYKKEGLVELVRKYKQYTPQMCREKLRGKDLISEGIALYQKSQWREALGKLAEALKIFQRIGDTNGEAKALTNIGVVYDSLSRYTEALSYHQQALEIARKIGDVAGEAKNLTGIGNVYDHLGQHAEALSYYKQALAIDRKIGDVAGEAKNLTGIGYVHDSLGQYTEALSYYKQALAIDRKIGDVGGEAADLGNIGNVYDGLGQYTEALSYHRQALAIDRKIGDVAGEAAAFMNIGIVYYRLGQYTEALNNYQQALAIDRKTGDVAGQARDLLNIGIVYYRLGQYTEAIRPLQESIKISEKIGVVETVWRANRGLGESLWKSGNPEEAVAQYQKAIDTIEDLYSHTQGLKEEERSSMIGEKSFVYREFIELLLELHRKHPAKGYDKQAFLITEKSKSRTFQELMAKAGAKIAFAEEAKDETFKKMIEKEQQLIIAITNLRTLLTKELSKPEKAQDQGVITSLKEQLSKTEKSLNDLEKEIEAKYPRYADLKRPKSLTVEELQGVLKPGETILAYAVGREKVVAFVISKKGFKMVELAVTPGALAQLVKQFRKGLDDVYELKDLEQFSPEIAYTLYQQLVAPLSSDLKGITKLYISADGILYTLPFEALVDQEIDKEAFRQARTQWRLGQGAYLGEFAILHYLVDTYTITYLPSASVLRSLRKYEKPGYGKWAKPLIAFADPIFSANEGMSQGDRKGKMKGVGTKGMSQETQFMAQLLTRSSGGGTLGRLKESAQEAKAIAQEVKGKGEDIYLRDKATEANVYKTKLKDARYILFSTHGLLGGDFTGVAGPALVLTLINNPPGRDGFLTMSKVLGLDLNAELVILSACNTTGKGDKAGQGEGFVGLTRSFMYAGTRSILVTHWSVESQAARDLMVSSLKNMQKETRPEALREAKLQMKGSVRSDKEVPGGKLSLSHPFFWAPFVLVGEGE
jgi:CHAT domain-containing protein/Tfp pilus assembly protein PilF